MRLRVGELYMDNIFHSVETPGDGRAIQICGTYSLRYRNRGRFSLKYYLPHP